MKFASFTTPMHPESGPVDVPRHPGATTRFKTLSASEESQALAGAYEYAKSRGVDAPAFGNSLYDLGLMAHTVALSAVDVDSPEASRARFFDSADQIVAALHIDEIAYLFEQQELLQSEHSPYTRRATFDELIALAKGVVRDESDAPFLQLSPAMRASSWRTLAALAVSFLEAKSPDGSHSEDSGTN